MKFAGILVQVARAITQDCRAMEYGLGSAAKFAAIQHPVVLAQMQMVTTSVA